ncbi:hypothetical protein QTL97_13540 [Sporosarcina thermotolerans]|uniref:Uncharacterized protein n=1 Tax=Sporosarcina thermotolerans TaxID=633404 RepID=A0AAW9A971_9BACL|nr:hypothetical protein [Sporosarcina thermotolerans]MDW0117962.1 hypothetical protein [Sporosarcina thermotolerans]WHT49045.1 hypothetical protein QNH10_05020 [Sporosarcina thermotolerans]
MNGRTLVIGLVMFVLIIVAVIYFAMTAQFDKDQQEDHKVEIID